MGIHLQLKLLLKKMIIKYKPEIKLFSNPASYIDNKINDKKNIFEKFKYFNQSDLVCHYILIN
jgi:hypothetical protein